MDKTELNKQIKQLAKDVEAVRETKPENIKTRVEMFSSFAKRHKHLYEIDPEFEVMSHKSALIMLRLQSVLRSVDPGKFGASIDLSKLT